METLKNIHEEYLNKLAEEIAIKACVKECKCDSDNLTVKKKCLFRMTLIGSDKEPVDLWFDMIDAVSEVIYTKTVDDMAYPELIRDHFSQIKAKSFYKVLSDDFESIISEIFKKVCLKIPYICREKPGFEELTNYVKQELLEYFTFKKVFSYSRYMIENHSYIEDWFPIADMDTEEILKAAEREPRTLYMTISKNNYKYTKNLEELIEYTYSEMYEKDLSWLKNIFVRGIFNKTRYTKEDKKIVFRKKCLRDEEYDDDDDFDDDFDDEDDENYDVVNGLKILIECYKNHGVSVESYYSDVNERIGHIIAGTKNGAAKKKRFGDIIDDDGNYIKGKCKGIELTNDKKLAESRLHIYKTQMIPLNDNMYFNRSDDSKSKGDFNELVRSFYMDLYGLDLSKIYKKDPYNFHNTKKRKHPLWFPKCIDLVKPLKIYEKRIKNDEYKMLGEWNLHYSRFKVLSFQLIPRFDQYPSLADIDLIVNDTTIDDKNYYESIFEKTEKKITRDDGKLINLDKARMGEGLLIEKKEAIRNLIETLTISLFIISPDYKTLKNAISLSDTESKKLRCLIEMVFDVEDE